MSLQSWKVLLWIPLKFPWAIAARWRCFYLGLPNGVLSLSSPIIGKLIMSVAPNTPIGPHNHLRDFTIIVFPRRAHHWCPRVCGPFLLSSLLFIVFWNFFLKCPLHLSKSQLPWMNDFCFFFFSLQAPTICAFSGYFTHHNAHWSLPLNQPWCKNYLTLELVLSLKYEVEIWKNIILILTLWIVSLLL